MVLGTQAEQSARLKFEQGGLDIGKAQLNETKQQTKLLERIAGKLSPTDVRANPGMGMHIMDEF